jgi:hypothetical protein
MRIVWYVLICRECDPDLTAPMPFQSARERGQWASAHTLATGHERWFVDDEPVTIGDVAEGLAPDA